jgi:hypothetical protein
LLHLFFIFYKRKIEKLMSNIYSSSSSPSSSSIDLASAHISAARRRIGLLTSSAGVRVVVPPGPLATGAVPVPPWRSTATLTPAGPQAPEVPTILQRVTFFVASLKNVRVRECPFVRMVVLGGVDSLGDSHREAVCENVLDAAELRALSSGCDCVVDLLDFCLVEGWE